MLKINTTFLFNKLGLSDDYFTVNNIFIAEYGNKKLSIEKTSSSNYVIQADLEVDNNIINEIYLELKDDVVINVFDQNIDIDDLIFDIINYL